MSPQASAELVAAVNAANGQPIRVADPDSNRVYVVQCVEVESKEPEPPGPVETIPAGIRAAQEAFWTALPTMLKDRKLRGKWVVFSPEGLIGVSHSTVEVHNLLAADWERRYADRVEPMEQPPWVPELVSVPDRSVFADD